MNPNFADGLATDAIHSNRIAGLLKKRGLGCFQSSEEFSQVIPGFENVPA